MKTSLSFLLPSSALPCCLHAIHSSSCSLGAERSSLLDLGRLGGGGVLRRRTCTASWNPSTERHARTSHSPLIFPESLFCARLGSKLRAPDRGALCTLDRPHTHPWRQRIHELRFFSIGCAVHKASVGRLCEDKKKKQPSSFFVLSWARVAVCSKNFISQLLCVRVHAHERASITGQRVPSGFWPRASN